METRILTCVVCPTGCELTVTLNGGAVASVNGNSCKRGERYANDEILAPLRTLTSTALVQGARELQVPLRSSTPISKGSLMDVMQIVRTLRLCAPIRRGDVLVANVLNTGADLVATADALCVESF